MKYINQENKIFIAGHRGMVGSAISRNLKNNGYINLLTAKRSELDLTETSSVKKWYEINNPDVVVIAAAKVGGILANSNFPAEFLLDNLKIQNNLIEGAFENGVSRLLFLGSSCIYPKFPSQPIKEESLLSDSLESTNQWYAIAKIAGIKLCEALSIQYGFDAISLMPTNLYGPGDYYHPEESHVIPALISKFDNAVKNNLEKVNTGSFSSNISYKNINQSNMNEANSKSMFLSFGINPFLLGINVDQTDSSGLVEFESDNISFFGKYFFGKFNDFSINLIHTNADIEEIRSRTFHITTSGLNNIYLVNNYDLSLTSFTFDYSRKSNLREDEDNGWTYKSVFSFSVNNLDAPGFSENNHPNGLDITYESIDNIFLGIGFSAYSYKENIFNSPNLFFTSSLNLNFTNSLGSRNSYIDKNLGSFQINIEDSFQDLFQVAAELIYRADRVDYGFGINLSNTLSNFSIGVKVNLQ